MRSLFIDSCNEDIDPREHEEYEVLNGQFFTWNSPKNDR
jgi:hypothetical protein